MLPYLDAVAEGDEEKAIRWLAWQVLAAYPNRLAHEYVRWQLDHLTFHGGHPDTSKEFRQRAAEALENLVMALGFGLTGRWVTFKTIGKRRGQAPALFPLMDDQEPATESEASRHRMAASDFVHFWDDLMTRLRTVRWKAALNEYRTAQLAGKELAVAELAESLKPILQKF